MQTNDLPLTLTVDETAEQLRVSRRTVFNLLEQGLLKSTKVGRARRIHTASVRDYLKDEGQA